MDVVNAETLAYSDFCDRYMCANVPVKLVNITQKWFGAATQWGLPDGSINYNYLRQRYGHAQVPIVDGAVAEYGSESRSTMNFGEYLDSLESGVAGKRYLKDWHFVREFQDEEPAYTTPIFFQDDWLNWWWDQKEDEEDYRFVYIGPTGSWTPLHHDVFRSYSWSVNITGRKRWIFYHPDDEWKLKDRFNRFLVSDVTSSSIDMNQFPHLHLAKPIEVIQEKGEAIFVPSGWLHQVENLENTISINHNWFNGFCLDDIWQYLRTELDAVEKELSDLKEVMPATDWRGQCQVVLRANVGMHFDDFQTILVSKSKELKTSHTSQYAHNHVDKIDRIIAEMTAMVDSNES